MLAGFRVALRFQGPIHGLVENSHQLAAPSERIHGAAFDQRLQNALVEQTQIHFLTEFVNGMITSQFFSPSHDRLNGVVANVFHGGETEANRTAMRRKFASLTLMSGGSTAIPISRHSLMYFTTSSVLPVTEVSRAAINSTE